MKVAAGRRAADGQLRLSVFAEDLLAVALEGNAERAPTLLLSREQARGLRDALDELIRVLDAEAEAAARSGGEHRQRPRAA